MTNELIKYIFDLIKDIDLGLDKYSDLECDFSLKGCTDGAAIADKYWSCCYAQKKILIDILKFLGVDYE